MSMRAVWNGAVLAESDETVVVEGNHYFPRSLGVIFGSADTSTAHRPLMVSLTVQQVWCELPRFQIDIGLDGLPPFFGGAPWGRFLQVQLGDRELWKRGHRFTRYADDIRVFTRSRRAAQRVFDSIADVVEKRLKLKVNRDKSSVLPAAEATLLGFGFYFRDGMVKIRVDPKAIKRLKMRLRDLTRRNWAVSMDYRIGKLARFIVGWMGYFRLADASYVFQDVDSWLRRRLRQIRWKEWKRPAPGAATCARSVSPHRPPGNGRQAVRDIGVWQVPLCPEPCPTPTGTTSDCPESSKHGNASNNRLDEPPDAGPHVRWCERGPGDPDPYSIP